MAPIRDPLSKGYLKGDLGHCMGAFSLPNEHLYHDAPSFVQTFPEPVEICMPAGPMLEKHNDQAQKEVWNLRTVVGTVKQESNEKQP